MSKPNIPSFERRSFSVELRMDGEDEEGKKPTMRGHAAVFDSPSELMAGCFREIIRPGAFSGAFSNYDTRALFNHNPDNILGRSSSGTLRMKEDEAGLAIEIDPPETRCGQDLKISMSRGDIREMSFGFTVAEDGDEWTRDPDDSGNWTRTISKFERIYDVSPVTYPAYPQTDLALRSLDSLRAKETPPIDEIFARRLRLDLEAALL